MSKLFEIGSATAYTRYVQGLSDALRLRDWIYDHEEILAIMATPAWSDPELEP